MAKCICTEVRVGTMTYYNMLADTVSGLINLATTLLVMGVLVVILFTKQGASWLHRLINKD